MGQAISAAVDDIVAGKVPAEKNNMDDLNMLQKMADAKLDAFQYELTEKFLNPETIGKTQIPGIRPLRFQRGSYVKLSGEFSNQIGDAIRCFFGKKAKQESALHEGFQEVVKTALDAFLSNTRTGEFDEEKFFVYMMHNTVVRLDVKLFRWNFAPEGILSTISKSVLGYVVCLSVVDPSKLKTAEFVYLISEYAGDNEQNVVGYINMLAKIYNAARNAKVEQSRPVIAQLENFNE